MTLPLELGGIHDDNVRRALERIAQQFPIAPQNLATRMLWGGVVGTTGAVLTAGSGGWTVSRTALGHYTLTFAPAFSAAPAVLMSCVQALVFPSADPTTSGVGVFIENGGATAFIDSDWWFIALGSL